MSNQQTAEETEFDRGYNCGQRDCREYYEERLSELRERTEDRISKYNKIGNELSPYEHHQSIRLRAKIDESKHFLDLIDDLTEHNQ